MLGGQKPYGASGALVRPVSPSAHYPVCTTGAGKALAAVQAVRDTSLARVWRQLQHIGYLACKADMLTSLYNRRKQAVPERTTMRNTLKAKH